MKIFLTGDTHGGFSRIETFCKENKTSPEDILIILGDSGINYYCSIHDTAKKIFLSELPITLFLVHGNHEERPFNLPNYYEQEWNGGMVYVEKDFPNLLFAKDGEIYDLCGRKTVVIGGAYSVDKYVRLARGWKWFQSEQASEEIMKYVEKQLAECDWEVDIVLSHTCPLKYEPVEVFLSGVDQSKVDKTMEQWLDRIEERLDYLHWFCGHFHTQKMIEKLQFMFVDYAEFPEK